MLSKRQENLLKAMDSAVERQGRAVIPNDSVIVAFALLQVAEAVDALDNSVSHLVKLAKGGGINVCIMEL